MLKKQWILWAVALLIPLGCGADEQQDVAPEADALLLFGGDAFLSDVSSEPGGIDINSGTDSVGWMNPQDDAAEDSFSQLGDSVQESMTGNDAGSFFVDSFDLSGWEVQDIWSPDTIGVDADSYAEDWMGCAQDSGNSVWDTVEYSDWGNQEDSDLSSSQPPTSGKSFMIQGTGLPTALPATGTSGSLESFSTEAPEGIVVDLRVTLTLDHNCTKDLSASLVSPGGSSVLLFDMSKYVVCSANMENTQFDDAATNSILSAFKPFTGVYQPVDPLSSFKGEQGSGVWKLQLYDDTIGDSGKLKSWSVELMMD